jgi:hypothetical protein
MRLHCLTDATGTTNVGRFNYISIYPWWQVQVTNTNNTITLTTGSTPGTNILIPGTTNNIIWANALNNATNIQNAINSLGATGGTVHIPAGTFMIAQANPDEGNDAWQNSAISILTDNIVIAGAGQTETTLIAYNLATTIFSLGQNSNAISAQCTNFTLRDLTLEGQPHREVSGSTSTVYNASNFIPYAGEGATGDLTVFYGPASNQFSYNILITNCQFLSDDRLISIPFYVSDVMVRGCNFVPTGMTDTFGSNNVYTGNFTYADIEVSIYQQQAEGGYAANNMVVLENTYNGNCSLTTTNTLWTNYYWLAPDGLVWFQDCPNAFVARNIITNYALEAVQLANGPNSVVGNTYYTFVSAPYACALCFDAYDLNPT